MTAEPTAEERAAVDAFLGPPASGWDGGQRQPRDTHTAEGGHAARGRRHLLLPAFHAVQSRVGWISEGALNYISERLTVPPADAYGVATFYALLSTVPRPRRVVHVCDDIACRCKGAEQLCAELERAVGPAYHGPDGDHHEIPADGAVWLRSPCLGLCDQAPAALLTVAGEAPVERLVRRRHAPPRPRGCSRGISRRRPCPIPGCLRRATRRSASCGGWTSSTPRSLDEYRANGGYQPLRRALDLGPEGIIREVIGRQADGTRWRGLPHRQEVGGRVSTAGPARTT